MDSLAVVGGVDDDDDMMAVESWEGVRSSRLALTSKSQHFMSVGSLRQDETAASDDSASLCACGEKKRKAESMKRTGKRRNHVCTLGGNCATSWTVFFKCNRMTTLARSRNRRTGPANSIRWLPKSTKFTRKWMNLLKKSKILFPNNCGMPGSKKGTSLFFVID